MRSALCFLLLLVAGISAKPITRATTKSCGSTPNCVMPSNLKFAYENNKAYTYDVKSTVRTSTSNPDSEQSGLDVTAKAKVSVLAPCEFQLELSDLDIKNDMGEDVSDSEANGREAAKSLPLPVRFEWNDGRIGDVCPTSDADMQWTLNFKRSILSALQNTMDSLDNAEPVKQLDVSGNCWANFEVVSADTNRKVVQWTKDLNQCSDRQGGLVATYGKTYNNPMSDINTMPLTEGKQICTQTVEKRIIEKVECEDRLEFLPTRLQEDAVTVVTVAKMSLKRESEGSASTNTPDSKYVTDLKFDHSYIPANMASDASTAEALLKKTCDNDGEVGVTSGRDLSDLLDSLRSLNSEELATVFTTASKCKATEKMMENIMPDVGTAASAKFIVSKASMNEPKSSIVREDWLAALRTVLAPTADILEKAAKTVVSDDEYAVAGRGYLGVGSVMENFCRNRKDCMKVAEVKAAVQHFADQLKVCRSGSMNNDEKRKAVYSLRALANAGSAIALEGMPEIVLDCMRNKQLPTDVRLSAISVLRRVPCGMENNDASALYREIIRDSAEDTEFRSVALVYAMRCPCLGDLEAVRTIFEASSVHPKFGPFAASFLSRMEEQYYSNYWPRDFRSTLSALLSTRKVAEQIMKVDNLKTGSAMVRQEFWPGTNVGYMYDVDLIHSDNSMAPRSFRMNVSIALFGRAINPLELGIRHEGLEEVASEMPEDGLPSMNKLKSVLQKLKLNVFARVFGAEVRYAAIDNNVIERFMDRVNRRFSRDMMTSDEGRQAAELFMDRALSLPTVAGLPIRIGMRGSYRSHVRPNLDMKRGGAGVMSFKADVKAGLSVELRSFMSAYVGARQFGIQAVTRVVSQAEYKPEIEIKSNSLKIKVDTPNNIVRAASISNEVMLRRDQTEMPVEVDTLRTEQMCSPGLTGYQVCVDARIPSRWNGPMTPGKLAITLKKVEESTRAIELELLANKEMTSDGQPDALNFKAYFNTPGSSFDRKLLAELSASRSDSALTANLHTPWKKANLMIKRTGDQDNAELMATLSIGEESVNMRKYKVDITRKSSNVHEGNSVYPKRSVTMDVSREGYGKAILKASGSVTDMGERKEVTFEVAELNIPNYYSLPAPASVSGEIGRDETRGYGFTLKGKMPNREFETEYGIKFEREGNQNVYKHKLIHKSSGQGLGDEQFDRKLYWDVELRREPLQHLKVKSYLRSANVGFIDRANHIIYLFLERTDKGTSSMLNVDLGSGTTARRVLKLGHKMERYSTDANRGFEYMVTFNVMNMIDRTIVVKAHREWVPTRMVTLNAEIRRGEIALYQIKLDGRRDGVGLGEFKLRTLCPFSDFMLEGSGKKEINTYVHSLRLERNGDLRVNFLSKAKIEGNEREVNAELSLMGMAPITLQSKGYGSPFDGKWNGDGVLSHNGKKLMFGGSVDYTPKGENEGNLDMNIYFGTLLRMYKQYLNWHRVDRFVKLRGMTEIADKMYKITGELDMANRRHRLLIEHPTGSTELAGGRLADQRGYDLTLTHQCSAIELQLFSKAGMALLRSDFAGHLVYRLAGEKEKKVIGYKLGYKADTSDGVDLGVFSGVKINDKDWFANGNFTVMPGRKFEVALGAGNGDNFRHKTTIMLSRTHETEHATRYDTLFEVHCTGLGIKRTKFESTKRVTYVSDMSRIGAYDSFVRLLREDKALWYKINVDALNPKKAVNVRIMGETPYSKSAEMMLSFTSSLPTITVAGTGRYGDMSARLRGLIERVKMDKEGIDLTYSFSVFVTPLEKAQITINGQHVGDWKTGGRSFVTFDVRDKVVALSSQWRADPRNPLIEVIVRTPNEVYAENVIRVTGNKGAGKPYEDDTSAELVVKIGPKNIRFNSWTKIEPKLRRAELSLDVNGDVYSIGSSLDHPVNKGSRGEYRYRLHVDTPVEGYKTSSLLVWVNPTTHGMKGIRAVLGLTNDYPEITEQRSQFQIAYQIGEECKGGILMSARGERNYETNRRFREASIVFKLPLIKFSIDLESTRFPEKAWGFVDYKSERYGKLRLEWGGHTGHIGAGHLEIRRQRLGHDEPIIVRLAGNHDFSQEMKEMSAQITSNIPNYEKMRLRITQGLNEDDGTIVTTAELMMPDSRVAKAEIAFGFSIDYTDVKMTVTTPFEAVKTMNLEAIYTNEPPKRTLQITYNRNDLHYSLHLEGERNAEGATMNIKLETPFDKLKKVEGTYERKGVVAPGENVELTANLKVNDKWDLKLRGEARIGHNINMVLTTKNDEYKIIINKVPGQFELRLPMPWCTIHYEGEISTRDNIFVSIRHHHTCSPYAFAGNLTVSLMDTKQVLLNMETPIPYFKTFSANFTYDFDETIYQIEQRLPPIGVYLTIHREDKSLVMRSLINPTEKTLDSFLTVRGVTITANARVANPNGGHINLNIETPYGNVEMVNKREGAWINPANIEVSLTAANLDIYLLTGSWDFSAYPASYSVNADGAVLSKPVRFSAEGTTEGPRNWMRMAELKVGRMVHKTMVEMDGHKFTLHHQCDKKSFKLEIEANYETVGDRITRSATYQITKKGYGGLPYETVKWTSKYFLPSEVKDLYKFKGATLGETRRNLRTLIKTILNKGAEWELDLEVDGSNMYSSKGKIKVQAPEDIKTMVGLLIEYEVERSVRGMTHKGVIRVHKTDANKPTEFKFMMECDDEKKLDVSGTIFRRESFKKYAELKMNFEAPRQMIIEIERDATNNEHRITKAFINLDKSNDKEGTHWRIDFKPVTAAKARGFDAVISAKRADKEMLLLEAGIKRSFDKTFSLKYHLFGKTANMPKKFGQKSEIMYHEGVFTHKVEFSALTRDLKADLKCGLEKANKRVFIEGVYDLGTPSARLEVNIEGDAKAEIVKGTVKLGERTVDFSGSITASDRHNYEINANIADSDRNEVHFNMKKTWSEETRNRTISANLKTNKGYIEWNSHRYLADPIRSRGILVRYHKSEWPEGQDTVLYAFGEIDMSAPSLKINIMSPFRTADYMIRVKRGENGAKDITARLVEDGDKVSSMQLELRPADSSMDFLSMRADGTRLKIHSHVVSTKFAFLEARYTKEKDAPYTNLVKATFNVDPRNLNISLRYNTEIPEIMRAYVNRRREQAKAMLARYKENVPVGAKSIREIMLAEELVKPFVETLRSERQQLRENERAKWRELTRAWYESPVMKQMFGNRIPSYDDSVISKWLSDSPLFEVDAIDRAPDRAIVAIGEALRAFIKSDLIPDIREIRQMYESRMPTTDKSLRSTLKQVRDAVRGYLTEAGVRLRDKTWTSCLVHYVKSMPDRIEKYFGSERADRLRTALENMRTRMRMAVQKLVDAKERIYEKQNEMYDSMRSALKADVDYKPGAIDASIKLPYKKYRSLRMPAMIARRIENIRELLERGIAAVQARVANPDLKMGRDRIASLMQYFRGNRLRYLLKKRQ